MRITRTEFFIILFLCGVACLRYLFFTPPQPKWQEAVGKTIHSEGIVVSPPDIRFNSKLLVFTPKGYESHILLRIPRSFDVAYGDHIQIEGILQSPEPFTTAKGKEFDYPQYLALQDIYFIIEDPKIEIVSRDNGNLVKESLFLFRNRFMENITDVIPPPRSDLANGLILGARGGFDSNTREEFISTGTIHIVALSGYNVTIISENVMKVFGLVLSKMASLIGGFFVIVFFIIMAGASSTAVRAGIMASIALLGQMTGRKYDAGRALIIAALLMIAYDPRTIVDISFQLSFLATFGVLFITPKVINWVRFMPLRFKLRELTATTIAATIAVLPNVLYQTGTLSFVSLPANMLILPFIPLAMLGSFITGALGFISHPVSLVFGYVSHLLLSYILFMVDFFASLPFASTTIRSFPLVFVVVSYMFILWWILKKENTVTSVICD